MKKNILKNNKGVTLLELVIGMALVAIISATVVMFSGVLSDLTNSVVKSDKEINDLSMFREFISNWFYSFDSEEKYVIIVVDDLFFIDENGDKYGVEIDLNEENVYVQYSNYIDEENSNKYHLSGVKKISFECYDENRLYKCIVFYNESEYSFILCRCCRFTGYEGRRYGLQGY